MSNPGTSVPVNSLESLRLALRQFVAERDWDQFHSPKNLAMALSVEASELLEHFQWMPEAESNRLGPEKLNQVREEMADVLIYLVRIADKLGVDLLEASSKKLVVNAKKYPVENARGSAKKYTDI
jgi:NTP pyrophosphatase (non-canonical NTP hydrolase)